MTATNTYTYPTSAQLKLVAQEFFAPTVLSADPIFDLFPIVEQNESKLIWEQPDNDYGLQALRGINGAPVVQNRLGLNVYEMDPGIYGDQYVIDEAMLTKMRVPGTFGEPISLDRLVAMGFDRLLKTEITRIRWILWTLLTTGSVTVLSPTGQGGAKWVASFSFQVLTSSVNWATLGSAAPLADLRTGQLKARGVGASFGSGSKLFMNKTTSNRLLNNQNANDMFGRRQTGASTINSIKMVNQLLLDDGLPQVVEYDRGYYQTAGVAGAGGSFTTFIPDGVAVWVGEREDGETIGEYRLTRNANNPNMEPGGYVHTVDSLNQENPTKIPRELQVHRGHNGGPVMYFPRSVIVFTTN